MTAKPDLRKKLRDARKTIAPSERIASARDATRHFLRNRKLASTRSIALYHTHGSELDTSPLIHSLLQAGRRVFLPTVTARSTIKFVQLETTSSLRPGRHGIAAPACGVSASLQDLDVIIVPLLGFDAAGRRLGSGAGYYDRLLARPKPFRRPLVVGYAYASQRCPRLPEDPWDRRLDAIVTERGVTWFRRT